MLKWFLRQNGLLDEALSYSAWVHNYREQRLCVGYEYRLQCQQLFNASQPSKHFIKVIRDPARRAVSSYLHYLRHSRTSPTWRAVSAVERWKRKAGLKRQQGLSFRQFLQFIASEQKLGKSLDFHFRPQYEPIQDSAVHSYIQLEHLAAELTRLERLFCLPHVDIRGLTESVHNNPPSSGSKWPVMAAMIPADFGTLQMLGTPAATVFLDPGTLGLIEEVYSCDYEAYGSAYRRSATAMQSQVVNSPLKKAA